MAIEVKLDRQVACPSCRTSDFVVDDVHSGDMVCTGCGVVLEGIVDDSSEYRFFREDNAPDVRHYEAAPLPLFTAPRPTPPSAAASSSAPAPAPGSNPQQQGQALLQTRFEGHGGDRLNKLLQGTATTAQKTCSDALVRIELICSGAGATHVVRDDAKKIFLEFKEHKSSKGRSVDALALACLDLAAKANRFPLKLSSLCKTHKEERAVGKLTKLIKSTLNTVAPARTRPEDLILSTCQELGLTDAAGAQCRKLCVRISELSLGEGKQPTTLVAGVLIFALKSKKDGAAWPARVATHLGITPATVSKIAATLEEKRSEILAAMDSTFLNFIQSP